MSLLAWRSSGRGGAQLAKFSQVRAEPGCWRDSSQRAEASETLSLLARISIANRERNSPESSRGRRQTHGQTGSAARGRPGRDGSKANCSAEAARFRSADFARPSWRRQQQLRFAKRFCCGHSSQRRLRRSAEIGPASRAQLAGAAAATANSCAFELCSRHQSHGSNSKSSSSSGAAAELAKATAASERSASKHQPWSANCKIRRRSPQHPPKSSSQFAPFQRRPSSKQQHQQRLSQAKQNQQVHWPIAFYRSIGSTTFLWLLFLITTNEQVY